MKSFKIAVCLSGQLRTWKVCHENILAFFDNRHYIGDVPVEVDYFIHTWDTNMWGHAHKGDQSSIEVTDIEDIKRVFQPKDITVDSISLLQPRPWDGLFHSLMKSIHMKKSYELANNFEYNMVVKARPDVIYAPNTKLPLHPVEPLVAYTSQPISKFPKEYFGNDFHDIIFYGDSPTMDLIGDYHREIQRLPLTRPIHDITGLWDDSHAEASRYGPGTALWKHLVANNIHPDINKLHNISPIIYTIVRRQVVEQNLHPMRDYKKIREIYFAWHH